MQQQNAGSVRLLVSTLRIPVWAEGFISTIYVPRINGSFLRPEISIFPAVNLIFEVNNREIKQKFKTWCG